MYTYLTKDAEASQCISILWMIPEIANVYLSYRGFIKQSNSRCITIGAESSRGDGNISRVVTL